MPSNRDISVPAAITALLPISRSVPASSRSGTSWGPVGGRAWSPSGGSAGPGTPSPRAVGPEAGVAAAATGGIGGIDVDPGVETGLETAVDEGEETVGEPE
ncbi:MAG: hypothetical protein ACXV1K_08880, partial [Kineosporiaceae bacterium]